MAKHAQYAYPDSKVPGVNMGPIWADSTQMGPMLVPWTSLSGYQLSNIDMFVRHMMDWPALHVRPPFTNNHEKEILIHCLSLVRYVLAIWYKTGIWAQPSYLNGKAVDWYNDITSWVKRLF